MTDERRIIQRSVLQHTQLRFKILDSVLTERYEAYSGILHQEIGLPGN